MNVKTTIIYNIGELVTVRGKNTLRKGDEMREVEILNNGYIVVTDDKFTALGSGDGYKAYITDTVELIDASGRVVTPGLIDSHTHLIHGGSREHEFELKLKGVPYMEILRQGGGILNTVQKTQHASFQELYDKAMRSLDIMLLHGVTTVEAKSGYGLELETELKQLQVGQKLNEDHPIEIIQTFMGAHAYPKAYANDHEGFLKLVEEMLPVCKPYARFCDVFCEEGVFSIEESRRLLTKAKEYGYQLKIHADEMAPIGGAKLACELGCVSADHLMASTNEDYRLLAEHNVVANVLPATSFNLDKPFANARKMIELGCGLALSTDYNPGSSPTENLQFVMQLGSIKLKMLPTEVLTAVTMNAACSLQQEQLVGSIEVGKQADFVIFDAPNLDYIIYHFAINHVKDVYKAGKKVVSDQRIMR